MADCLLRVDSCSIYHVVFESLACGSLRYTGDRSGMETEPELAASNNITSSASGAQTGRRSVTVIPDFFTGGPDQRWLDWVEDFDLHGDINGWTPEQRRQFLPIRLKGGPRDTYRSLTTEQKSSYDTLKATLTSRFEPFDQTELYRTEFRSRLRRGNERLLEFGMAVRTLASRAFPKMAVDQRDLLAQDQFIDVLNEDSFRLRVRRSKPTSLDDAIRVALEFEAIDTAEQRRQGTTSSSVASSYRPTTASDK